MYSIGIPHKINSYLIASFNKHLFTDHPFVLCAVRQYQTFCYVLHLLQNHPLKLLKEHRTIKNDFKGDENGSINMKPAQQ